MFLTRLGYGSKAVITGDVTQIDLPAGKHVGPARRRRRSCAASRASGSSPSPSATSCAIRWCRRSSRAYDRAGAAERGRGGASVAMRGRRAPALARRAGTPRRGACSRRCGSATRSCRSCSCPDRVMHELNRDWRGKRPPDRRPRVRAGRGRGRRTRRAPRRRRHLRRHRAPAGGALGRRRSASRADRLLIHGLLHLLGYDHERSPAEARRMQRRERAARARSARERMRDGRAVGRTAMARVAVAEPASRLRLRALLAVLSGLLLAAAFPSLDIGAARLGRARAAAPRASRAARPAARSSLGWLTASRLLPRHDATGSATRSATTRPCRCRSRSASCSLMASVLACYHGAFAAGIALVRAQRACRRSGSPPRALGDARVAARLVLHRLPVGRARLLAVPLPRPRADGRGDRRLRRLGAARPLQRRGGGGAARARARARGSFARRSSRSRCLVAVLPALGRWRVGDARARARRRARSGSALAQGNVEQDQKWDPAFQDETMARYRELTLEAARAEQRGLVVWPETAAPFFFQEPGPRRDERARARARGRRPAPLRRAGVRPAPGERPRAAEPRLPGRSVRPRSSATYDKMQLVPFGEYVPFQQVLFFVVAHGDRRRARSARDRADRVRASRRQASARSSATRASSRRSPAASSTAAATSSSTSRTTPGTAARRRPHQHLAQATLPGDREPRAARARRQHRASARSSTPTAASAGRAAVRDALARRRDPLDGRPHVLHALRRRLRMALCAGHGARRHPHARTQRRAQNPLTPSGPRA